MTSFEALIDRAETLLAPVIRETPLEPSPALSQRLGVQAWLKLECLQVTGSFKIRGALFALQQLRDSGASEVATCSAGNHGLGLAFAANLSKMPARIYVPGQVDPGKVELLRGMGADVRVSPHPGFDETEAWAMEEVQRDGIPFISAYDDELILAGNGGTLMREMRRQLPDLETLILPVGGGGLSGGMLLSAAAPKRLVAAQTLASPALVRSLEKGTAVTRMDSAETLAGGLEGGIGVRGFEALKTHAPQVISVSEEEIKAGVRWTLATHRYLIEPSSAVAVAAALRPEVTVSGPTVVVLTGRNIGPDVLRGILR
jgi:threonine dehydratase